MTKLGVLQIHQANEISLSDDFKKVSNIINKFPEVTSGLRRLKNIQVKLYIGNNVKPMLQHLHRVSFHMCQKIRPKID